MAIFLDVLDKFLIFFRSPGAFLESTFITTRRPSHFFLPYVFCSSLMFPNGLAISTSTTKISRLYSIYTHTLSYLSSYCKYTNTYTTWFADMGWPPFLCRPFFFPFGNDSSIPLYTTKYVHIHSKFILYSIIINQLI